MVGRHMNVKSEHIFRVCNVGLETTGGFIKAEFFTVLSRKIRYIDLDLQYREIKFVAF